MKNKILLISLVMTLLMLGTVMTAGATATDGYPCPTADGVIPTYYAGNDPQTNENNCIPIVPEGSYRVWFTTPGTYSGGTSDIIDENGKVIGTFHYSAPYQLTTSTCADDNIVGAWAFDWYVTGGYYTGIVNNKAGNGYLQYSYTNAFAEWDDDEGIYGPRTSDSTSPWAGISHITFCGYFTPGNGGIQELIDISKTAETSYTREHFWDISKSIDTEYDRMHDGYNKIWLYIDGSGDETATWTVDVTYEGYEDSNYAVSGDITITNSAGVDIVVTSIVDTLAGTVINVDCGCTLPVTVPAGQQLICTYSEEGYVEGSNVVDVTYYVDEEDPVIETATATINWEDAEVTEVNDVVNIQDISDLFDTVDLGTVTAPNGDTFTYDKEFAWADYGADGCGDFSYDNTATIVETGQEASATLKVNVQCFVFDGETAWAANGDVPLVYRYTNRGNWATYVAYAGEAKTTTLFAGQTIPVGEVTFSDPADGIVTIEVTMNEGWEFEDVAENLKVQDYAAAPSGNPAPGLFDHKKTCDPEENTCSIEVPENNFYGVHVNVGQWIPDPDFGP